MTARWTFAGLASRTERCDSCGSLGPLLFGVPSRLQTYRRGAERMVRCSHVACDPVRS